MRVRAFKKGFYKRTLREVDDEFEYDEADKVEELPSWVETLKGERKPTRGDRLRAERRARREPKAKPPEDKPEGDGDGVKGDGGKQAAKA